MIGYNDHNHGFWFLITCCDSPLTGASPKGKRVCGATMTSDGFGRWSVPSARDLADVFNMIIASNHSHLTFLVLLKMVSYIPNPSANHCQSLGILKGLMLVCLEIPEANSRL